MTKRLPETVPFGCKPLPLYPPSVIVTEIFDFGAFLA